jgi:site-specific DNA-methyltransferase (cytosine-N4-specific)
VTGLLQADAVALPLADDSVDLVVTSPPYFALRSYQDDGDHYDGQIGSEATPAEFLDALWAVTRECMRVLKPSGSLWVNLGDKYATQNPHQDGHRRDNPVAYKSLMGLPWRYALGCIDDLGFILRAEVVWSKPNGLPESVTDRVRRSHEQWFHFTLEPRYFSAIDEIREPYTAPPAKAQKSKAAESGATLNPTLNTTHDLEHNPLGKLPGSVWSIPSEPLPVPDDLGVDHFAAFPQEWPRRLILGWCPPDGVVLDPFAGTGTVPMVARALGRTGIGIDLSGDYLRLASWRVYKSGHAAKALARTNGERQQVLL